MTRDDGATIRSDLLSPVELLTLPPHTDYVAMATDGARFFAVYGDEQESVARELDIALDWFSDLKARVPIS